MAQREVDRCEGVVVARPPVMHLHLALLQRELLDDDAWHAGVGGVVARPTIQRIQQLRNVEAAIGPDEQARGRCRDADVGKAPRAAHYRAPLHLDRHAADGEHRRPVALGQLEVGGRKAQREGVEANLADGQLPLQLRLAKLGQLVADEQWHQPETDERVQRQHTGQDGQPALPPHPPD